MTSNWAKNHWIKWKLKKHNKCQEQDSWQVSEQNNKPHWIEWKWTKNWQNKKPHLIKWTLTKPIVDKLLSKKTSLNLMKKKTDKHNKCQEQDSWQVSEQYNKTKLIELN